MNSIPRNMIQVGAYVAIIQKHDQRTGKLTYGTVSQLLTRSASHPHGIKVRLVTGEVGRVQRLEAD